MSGAWVLVQRSCPYRRSRSIDHAYNMSQGSIDHGPMRGRVHRLFPIWVRCLVKGEGSCWVLFSPGAKRSLKES